MLLDSAKAAHQAATHEESKAEDRHDTFAIEASYLAAGQAERVNELEKCIFEFKYILEHYKYSKVVKIGALVKFKGMKEQEVFIALTGGGSQVEQSGRMVSIVTPTSPMGEELMGLSVGDDFEVETKSGVKSFKVLDIS